MTEQTKAIDEKYCGSCAAIIKQAAEICPKCGVRQKAASGQKNKTVAGVLALFLGGIGVHKFYLGQGGIGVLYLLFCWTLIPGIIAFVEAIIFFTMDEQVFAEKYS